MTRLGLVSEETGAATKRFHAGFLGVLAFLLIGTLPLGGYVFHSAVPIQIGYGLAVVWIILGSPYYIATWDG